MTISQCERDKQAFIYFYFFRSGHYFDSLYQVWEEPSDCMAAPKKDTTKVERFCNVLNVAHFIVMTPLEEIVMHKGEKTPSRCPVLHKCASNQVIKSPDLGSACFWILASILYILIPGLLLYHVHMSP